MTAISGFHHERGYNAGETTFMLRLALGSWRDWRDTLTDMRIGKTSVAGCTLQPSGHILGRGRRPIYVYSVIMQFIEAVRSCCPEAQKSVPPNSTIVLMQTGDTRGWRDCTFTTSEAGLK